MKIVRFLLRASPRMTALTAIVSLLSGAFNGGLVVVVHQALTRLDEGLPSWLLIAFCVVGAGKLLTGYLSEILLTGSAQRSLATLRLDLVRRLQRVPFRDFEQLGQGRVLSALTDEIGALNQAMYTLPAFAINVAMILGGAAYLVYLSPATLLLLGLYSLLGAVLYRGVLRRAYGLLGQARTVRDVLQRHFIALAQGMKELKLHRARRDAFTKQEFRATADRLLELDVDAHARFMLAHITTHLLLFVLIGLVIFVLPGALDLSGAAVSGYVLTALYLMGPMSGAAAALPVFSQASVALDRLEQLGLAVREREREPTSTNALPERFERVELRGLGCRYGEPGSPEDFQIGPIDFSLRPGEIVLVAGGNGSGKSTLAKLLTGLYHPDSGELLWDGRAVTDENRDGYRQLFSAVFSDFYLFETLLGLEDPALDARAARLLETLALSSKVRVEGGALSTVELSTGQRKRLALLTAYLEDRPIYVFDEWAADQDPAFKRAFYGELLPDLKARGKAVLVISHDDAYFHVADRRFVMREGRLAPFGAAPTLPR